jgi:hypothetical protein
MKHIKLFEEHSSKPEFIFLFKDKALDLSSIEVDGIDPDDRPDFVDAYVSYAEFDNGTPLSDSELDELNSAHPEIAQDWANENA